MTPPKQMPADSIRYVPLSYNNADSETSALRLILTIRPEWEKAEGKVDFVRFTDGITNTLLKVVKKTPGLTPEQIDAEAILLRAYGKGTDVLIDRERECASHSLLSSHHLAPPLLARFQNGLLYRFIRGRVCSPADLTQEPVWRGIARRLAEWHAKLPIISAPEQTSASEYSPLEINGFNSANNDSDSKSLHALIPSITPDKPTPNIWTVLQKWTLALPTTTEAEKTRKETLQTELKRLVKELGDLPGLGNNGLVFGHCDLLSGNVIIQPPPQTTRKTTEPPALPSEKIEQVSFIDYEYATPSPAAFDIANHFSEWGGFDCDYTVLPTRSTRRAFLHEYIASYNAHLPPRSGGLITPSGAEELLFETVDRYRGLPGFYWGIWALIQATISQIDFDYASYAEVRLGEYWDWRRNEGGESGGDVGLREKVWGSE